MRGVFIEPFDGGSHRAFRQTLTEGLPGEWTSLTSPDHHWKWRMRGGAAWFAETERAVLSSPPDVLFATSYLPLAELYGLVPELAGVPSILYFHENQLAYPVRREKVGGPDYNFGLTQMTSARAANVCVFNSEYNRSSFLDAAETLLRRMPDCVPRGWIPHIRERSVVLPLPLDLLDRAPAAEERSGRGPLILWNHRWEHDKNPEVFVDALLSLAKLGTAFRVAVAGQRFRQAPPCFETLETQLADRIVHFGHAERSDYDALLDRADVVVSTANHEFFGIAVLEAIHAGAMPLVPDRLAYRETVPAEFRYPADEDFARRLGELCARYAAGESLRADRRSLTARFASSRVLPEYSRLIFDLVGTGRRP